MGLKFFVNNYLNTATYRASSTNAQYPTSNISDPRTTKTFRTSSNSDTLVIDLGKKETVDSFCIVANSLDGWGVNSLTLEGNDVDGWSSPAFTQSCTLSQKFGVCVQEFSSSQSYRFWRLTMTSTLGYCELSNMFLGTKSEVTTNGIGYGWKYINNDLSTTRTNRYGQKFTDIKNTQKELRDLTFSLMGKDEVDTILNVYDLSRTTLPFFVKLDLENGSLFNDDDRFNGLYTFKEVPTFENVNSGFYNTTLNLIEAV